MPALPEPPNRAAISTKTGYATSVFQAWFQNVSNLLGALPLPLKSYTVATVPAAASYTNHVIYVSDETGGATLAFSDGTNWRRVQDRAVIS